MKKSVIACLVLLLAVACHKPEDVIEIYLLKERIRSHEGIPVLDYVRKKNIPYHKNIENLKDVNYDSISKEYIWAGAFEALNTDLTPTPLIGNDEIELLNLKRSELQLSTAGKKKIQGLKPNYKYGIQFVICVNKEVCFTGYFRENRSSNIFNWNYIDYNYEKSDLKVKHEENFVIRQNKNYYSVRPILTDLRKYPKLVAAFKNTNRLEE